MPASRDALGEHRMVGYVEDLIYAPALAYARDIWRGWRASLETSSAVGQVDAVRGGAGIGVLHDYLARGDVGLVPVLPEAVVNRSCWVAWHESLRGVARVEAVARFPADAVREGRAAFVRGAPAA
jgi:DNA-binding transcriptional LysR family regulator